MYSLNAPPLNCMIASRVHLLSMKDCPYEWSSVVGKMVWVRADAVIFYDFLPSV
jgi:hypothetical protein